MSEEEEGTYTVDWTDDSSYGFAIIILSDGDQWQFPRNCWGTVAAAMKSVGLKLSHHKCASVFPRSIPMELESGSFTVARANALARLLSNLPCYHDE